MSNENSSEETATDGWNYTATTSRSRAWRLSSDDDWLAYTTVVVQWIIFVVGTVGNILVLVVLAWRRSRSQVGTQLFVGSLAVADLGLMVTHVWMEAYDEMYGWAFGVIPCKLQYLWQWLTSNCSIWTLTALTIDRYLRAVLNFPLK